MPAGPGRAAVFGAFDKGGYALGVGVAARVFDREAWDNPRMGEEARSGWAAELRAAIALHDFAVAGNELMPSEERREQARLAVVAVLDRARKAGVSEADVDAEIQAYRRQALNTMELLRAVAAVGRERERVARKRGHDVERLHLAWAMMDEIGGRLGVGREELSPLRDHALDTGLLDRVEETATPDPRAGDEQVGWALTPAGRRCVEAGDLRAQPRPRPADERWPELGPDPREEDR
jgi:hypothetical protein